VTIELRGWRESDAETIVTACNDEVIQRYMRRMPTPYTLNDALAWIASGGEWQCAIVEPGDGRVLGSVGLRVQAEGVGEIGYWVAPWGRGRGLAAEAVTTLCERAFQSGFRRLYIRSALDNAAGHRVALTAGFRREGTLRGDGIDRDGTVYDLAVFSRLPGDPAGPAERRLPDFPDGGITDGIVTLRRLGPVDIEDTWRLHTLPEVIGESVPPRAPRREAIERRCIEAETHWLEGARAMMSIRDTATDKYAGDLLLMYDHPLTGQAMLGYSMLPEWRGRGYAARAVRLAAAWAFEQVGVIRLVAGTAPDNRASQRVLEAAGFRREAVQRSYRPTPEGQRVDNVLYVRLNSPAG
jgi:RimJ/RimL family protein N-acetyltransferase